MYQKLFQNYDIYDGKDLGAVYSKDKTVFRLWAPSASAVTLCTYERGDGDCQKAEFSMQKDVDGTWVFSMAEDCDKLYYTYKVTVDGICRETGDPYAKAVGVNGKRSMVIDLEKTNPEGFADDKGPAVSSLADMVVTEISVVDTTADASAGSKFPGKYLGLTERGTKNKDGISTALDHFKKLGVTHVQLMPSYDFGSIDESLLGEEQYNWGYDPVNYNVPEGSYSTDPFHGEVRIREFKEMVKAFHEEGIGVIMDVVYNHTYNVEDNCLYKTVPDYFYRKDGERYSDASACGNEIASDRPMVRKYIIDSLCYWAKEYHIDGFRFDLMGVLDIETMNKAYEELKKIKSDIVFYGEPWTGGDSVLEAEKRALKVNVKKLNHVSVFSDDIRDAVKGHVFYAEQPGFINGGVGMENDIKFCVTGGVKHPEVDYDAYEYTKTGAWAKDPVDSVNYVSCHDNLTLWDKNESLNPKATKEELLAMNRLAATIVFTAQGMPFFLSGEEFGRTKPIKGSTEKCENSYNMPLYTNSLKYDMLTENKELVEFYQGIIKMRKAIPQLRLRTAKEVVEGIHFVDVKDKNVVAYTIETEGQKVFVCYNANKKGVSVSLPDEKEYQVYLRNDKVSDAAFETIKNQTEICGVSGLVAVAK